MLVASLHRSAVLPVERRSISGPGAETWPFRGRCWQSKCRGSLFCTVLQCFCLFLRCIESWIVLSFACLHYACTLHCFWFLFPCFVISLLVQLRGSNGFAWGFEFQARGCGKGETAKRRNELHQAILQHGSIFQELYDQLAAANVDIFSATFSLMIEVNPWHQLLRFVEVFYYLLLLCTMYSSWIYLYVFWRCETNSLQHLWGKCACKRFENLKWLPHEVRSLVA